MLVVLIALFVILPLAELWLIVVVADSIGFAGTFLALILFSVLGGWLVRREGLTVWRRTNEQIAAGRIPTREISDGLMILGGGALLLTPGFITDLVGLALLLPPTRALIRPLLARSLAVRMNRGGPVTVTGTPGRQQSQTAGEEPWARVVDVEVNDPKSIDRRSGGPSAEG